MLTAIITQSEIAHVKDIFLHSPDTIEAFEWRLDYLSTLDVAQIANALSHSTLPVILTLRSQRQGGQCQLSITQQCRQIEALIKINTPCYIDVEHDLPTTLLEKIHPSPHCAIRSYHNYHETPDNLAALLKQLQHPAAHCIKIATHANNTLDSLRMLALLQTQQSSKLIAHTMGSYGLCSRYLGKIKGSFISYARLNTNDALDTIPTVADYQRHRYSKLNRGTKIYGLIGTPIDQSPGRVFHNSTFTHQQRNAVYVNFPLQENQLTTFMQLAKAIKVSGLSVTMPLKSAIIPFLDQHDPAFSAINTVNFCDKIVGHNTDGPATVELLRSATNLKQKRILILGAGGAASGIATSLANTDCQLFIYNRTFKRAQTLAEKCHASAIKTTASIPFDIIINTLPLAAQQDNPMINALRHTINEETYVLDIAHQSQHSPIMQLSQNNKAHCLHGNDMFERQARLQQEYWLRL